MVKKRGYSDIKKADGKWSWLGIGTYPDLSGAGARKKRREIIKDISHGDNPIITKQERKRQNFERPLFYPLIQLKMGVLPSDLGSNSLLVV